MFAWGLKRDIGMFTRKDQLFRSRPGRSGFAYVYTVITMTALIGLCSLAVDLGRVQEVKTDLQSCADATARSYMEYYNLYGQTYANTNGPAIYSAANNPVDSNSGVLPTVTVTWGTWNTATKTFSAGLASPYAVQVTVSRKAANGNGVPLTWGTLIGRPTCDVSYTAVAALIGSQTVSATIPATANPYLAGMPAGTTTIYNDTIYNATPYQVSGINVIPGTFLTFTSVSGSTTVLPGYMSYYGPNGDTSDYVWHGENYNGNPNSPTSENNIADALMPESALFGVFLNDNVPTSNSTPPTIDWSSISVQNQTQYTNLMIQQPFYIGNGMTTSSVVQQYQVPAGATRLFLGTWDGVDYNNNLGSTAATVTVKNYVQIVQ